MSKARAIALRAWVDADLIPNHISVAKPRIEPPTRRVAQMDTYSGSRPYNQKTKRGKKAQDTPKKSAMKMLILKRRCRFKLTSATDGSGPQARLLTSEASFNYRAFLVQAHHPFQLPQGFRRVNLPDSHTAASAD